MISKNYIILIVVLAAVLAALLAFYLWLGGSEVLAPTASAPAGEAPAAAEKPVVDVSGLEAGLLLETSALDSDLADIESFEKDASLNSLEAELGGLTQ